MEVPQWLVANNDGHTMANDGHNRCRPQTVTMISTAVTATNSFIDTFFVAVIVSPVGVIDTVRGHHFFVAVIV